MYRSPPSSQDTHDDHLRNLLDQRSARADVQGRFSTISEYMDTPSVYSRTNFSPRAPDRGDHHLYRGDYDDASPISPSVPRSNDAHIHDQSTSMLDLDDDPRSSFAPSESYDDEPLAYDGGGDEMEIATRMSYLGPKMRFHSRAPWEMEGDALEEEDEADQAPRQFPPGYPFDRSTGSKLGSSRSSSPRPGFNGRPSGESSRSHIPPKRSFETISSQMSYPRGALYALAQESLSTNSLARAAAPPKETLRSKFSFGRLRPDAPTGPLPPSPVRGRFLSSPRGHEQPSFKFVPHTRSNNIHYVNKSHADSTQESMHPYANPDLVVSYADDEPENFTSDNVQLPRNDSNSTVTESSSTDSMMKSSSRSTLTPDTSINSIVWKHRASSISAKSISSPVPVVGPPQRIDSMASDNYSIHSLPPTVSNLPGWTERNTPPTFSLISLEEARAQRTRSSTVTVPSRISTSSGLAESSTPFPAGDTESVTNVQVPDPAPYVSSSRVRARSISAGAKTRNAIQTMVGPPKLEHRGESEPISGNPPSAGGTPTGKSLKHKKSGFMRLFNGGRTPEKDGRSSPPPVPSLPDTVAQPQPIQRTPKTAIHRIPVPSLSPTLLESTTSQDNVSALSKSDSWKSNPSPRRTPPTLSIKTVPQGIPSRSSTSHVHSNILERPWLNEQPQSAPAHVSQFPALRLRPVSTLFSAHFGEHIVTGESRSSDETTDVDTPRSSSPNGLMSPITPASFFTRGNDKTQIPSEDQSSLKALQEEFDSSKKAWQRHVWELEGQVRDLKVELADTKAKNNGDYCQTCGRGTKKESAVSTPTGSSIVNRPRARTGISSRFGNALP